MINVTFVCLGNICRSPMGELILKQMVKDKGFAFSFNITSCGTEAEVGCSIYPPAKQTLERHGIHGEHIAKQITLQDVINNDYVLVMDGGNLMDVLRLTCGKFGEKVYRLRSFTANPRDVADPWYTRNFEKAYEDIREGCERFLDYIEAEHAEALDYDKRH